MASPEEKRRRLESPEGRASTATPPLVARPRAQYPMDAPDSSQLPTQTRRTSAPGNLWSATSLLPSSSTASTSAASDLFKCDNTTLMQKLTAIQKLAAQQRCGIKCSELSGSNPSSPDSGLGDSDHDSSGRSTSNSKSAEPLSALGGLHPAVSASMTSALHQHLLASRLAGGFMPTLASSSPSAAALCGASLPSQFVASGQWLFSFWRLVYRPGPA
uniref:Uncharacterized protein n=2 Tax=Plectus sambesii TaxID=2011161 RepID=A0A914W3P3_9BILA